MQPHPLSSGHAWYHIYTRLYLSSDKEPLCSSKRRSQKNQENQLPTDLYWWKWKRLLHVHKSTWTITLELWVRLHNLDLKMCRCAGEATGRHSLSLFLSMADWQSIRNSRFRLWVNEPSHPPPCNVPTIFSKISEKTTPATPNTYTHNPWFFGEKGKNYREGSRYIFFFPSPNAPS